MSRGEVLRRLDTPVVPGAVYGSLTVLRLVREEQRLGQRGGPGPLVRFWLCACTCGREEEIAGRHLRFDGWTACPRCRRIAQQVARRRAQGIPPRPTGNRLTPEQVATLERLVREGRQTTEILSEIGRSCTEQTVTAARRRLGVKVAQRVQGMRLNSDEIALVRTTILEMPDQPRDQIAAVLAERGLPSVGGSTISRYRKALGLPRVNARPA